jgi:hypothetical protein
MLLHAVDAVEMGVLVFDNAPNIPVKLFALREGKCTLAVFRTENDVIKNLTITGRYDVFVTIFPHTTVHTTA